MSVYSDLLRAALEQEPARHEDSVGDLVALVVSRRATLTRGTGAGDGTARSAAAEMLGDELSYDAALVHLCDRLDVAHELASPGAGPTARRHAEVRLAAVMPAIGDALGNEEEKEATAW